ncbi:MAG: VOC family protein [Coriobacteriales bacterium]|nr:VOC family protein [Coriobacteriales bacterium]
MERRKQGELTWVDLAAKDLEQQTRFYEGLFGWHHEDIPTDQGPIYRMFTHDGHRIAGASQMNLEMEQTGMPSMWNTYLAAQDAEALAHRAEELGGRVVMPAMDVMAEGRMVGIQDPTGGTVFFWQAGEHGGAEEFGTPGTIMWGDLETRDPERAVAFYKELLGWDIQRAQSDQPYWTVSVDGQPEAGIMPMPEMIPSQVPPYWLDYFAVDDAQAAVDKARDLGATIDVEPTDVGVATFAVLTDPAGATFAIMTPVQM